MSVLLDKEKIPIPSIDPKLPPIHIRGYRAHHTISYPLDHIFIRRGASLDLEIDQKVVPDKDLSSITVLFYATCQNSIKLFKLFERPDSYGFYFTRYSKPQTIDLHFWSLINSPVGHYELHICVGKNVVYSIAIFLLFNPYFEHDNTFILTNPNDEDYIISRTCIIPTVSQRISDAMVFYIDQYSPNCVNTARTILAGMSMDAKRHPEHVMREFAGMVCIYLINISISTFD
ncbi:hypothetical protein RF11_14331 [Thelohanellus kitauei]|uniref:Uncharacterized protein n=1 Tax=Thelohanellus kitauei TaxID=669202 RepID=A0A0C2N147_THEKT|nr:hypothetical protein RF11_14331 [Thelohanellus kitauei]